jgi:hypothetical protein
MKKKQISRTDLVSVSNIYNNKNADKQEIKCRGLENTSIYRAAGQDRRDIAKKAIFAKIR